MMKINCSKRLTFVCLVCNQSITALAHLRAAVLYIVDISEQCGYTIAQQAALFESVKPLFANKPVLIVCNKTDQKKMEDLDEKEMGILKKLAKDAMELGSGGNGSELALGPKPLLVSPSTQNPKPN